LWLQKIAGQKKFPPPLLVLLLLDPGSGMDKNQNPGSLSQIRNTAIFYLQDSLAVRQRAGVSRLVLLLNRGSEMDKNQDPG
jgi:hypothetical protein